MTTMSRRLGVDHPDAIPPWTACLRRELVEAYRRGTMDAERCLRSYLIQGEPAIFPPEALVYLAASHVAGPSPDAADPRLAAEALHDLGEDELAELMTDRLAFELLVDAGRRFFFPARRIVG